MSNKRHQGGFTLVELMIATAIFAVVIVIGMYGFIQVSRFYTKSLTIIRTQDAARNLITDISNQLQLTTGQYQFVENGDTKMVCIGSKAYVYKINVAEGTANKHAITSYDVPPDTCSEEAVQSSQPVYLLRPGVRVLRFDVSPYPDVNSGPLFDVTIALLYAPKDNTSSDPTDSGTELIQGAPGDYENWRCTATVSGSQYCSLSTISTSVYKRAQGS
jgi:prepilin-type N-terminal cleavage/methylation domain-containing protein